MQKCKVSEIYAFLLFMQKFKMVAENDRKTVFAEIALSCTISKINVLLCFTQKFKMAIQNALKTIFEKNRQMTLRIPWG